MGKGMSLRPPFPITSLRGRRFSLTHCEAASPSTSLRAGAKRRRSNLISCHCERSEAISSLRAEGEAITTATSWPRNDEKRCHCEPERSEGEAISSCPSLKRLPRALRALAMTNGGIATSASGRLAMTKKKTEPRNGKNKCAPHHGQASAPAPPTPCRNRDN